MTRNERRGTIVLLVIIALLLVGCVVARSCSSHDTIAVDAVEMEDFKVEADSAIKTMQTRQHSATQRTRHERGKSPSRKKRPHREKKQSPPERRMDPVPQF